MQNKFLRPLYRNLSLYLKSVTLKYLWRVERLELCIGHGSWYMVHFPRIKCQRLLKVSFISGQVHTFSSCQVRKRWERTRKTYQINWKSSEKSQYKSCCLRRNYIPESDFSVFVIVELFLMCRGRIEDEVVAGEVVEEINKKETNCQGQVVIT